MERKEAKAASNEKQEGEKQREYERRGDQKEDALSALWSCFLLLLLLNIQPPYWIGLELAGQEAGQHFSVEAEPLLKKGRSCDFI